MSRISKPRFGVLPSVEKPQLSLFSVFTSRFIVLFVLLLFQSTSSTILSSYISLLQRYPEITLFLTMCVGAGGNASNQAAVEVIRGLATGDIVMSSGASITYINTVSVVLREMMIALSLGFSLFVLGFLRVWLSMEGIEAAIGQVDSKSGPLWISLAIAIALFFIVLGSVTMGALLPLLLNWLKLDPAHAGPICQVLADIFGVLILCVVCNALLL